MDYLYPLILPYITASAVLAGFGCVFCVIAFFSSGHPAAIVVGVPAVLLVAVGVPEIIYLILTAPHVVAGISAVFLGLYVWWRAM